jgi:hypothetical protein
MKEMPIAENVDLLIDHIESAWAVLKWAKALPGILRHRSRRA